MPICASVGNGRAILFPSRPDYLYVVDFIPSILPVSQEHRLEDRLPLPSH